MHMLLLWIQSKYTVKEAITAALLLNSSLIFSIIAYFFSGVLHIAQSLLLSPPDGFFLKG